MISTAEYILFGSICFFPFMLFAYYPLRYFKRFSTAVTFLLEMVLSIPEILIFLLAFRLLSGHYGVLVAVILVFNVLAYMLLYKIGLGRILFNLLLIVNVANFTVIFAKYLGTLLFPGSPDMNFHWTNSICVLITELVFVLPVFLFIKHFSDSMIRNSDYDYIWRVAWLVPMILSTFGLVLIYTPNLLYSTKSELYLKQSVICAMIVLCLMLIYSFIAKLIQIQHNNLKLEENIYHQSLQQMQYHRIEQQIKDTRIIRHDLRHHINLMCNYVEQGENERLKEYLYRYSQSIEQISRLHYTDNTVLNTLLVYYADICRSSHIEFDAEAALPDALPMQDNEITVLFGNLLENAYQACCEMEESNDRHLSVKAFARANMSLFIIENSFGNDLKQDGVGEYMTTKSGGSGIGIQSAKEIVAAYEGYIDFQAENGVFTVSISIPNKPVPEDQNKADEK